MARFLERWGRVSLQQRDLVLAAAILMLATVLRAGWPTLTEFKFSEARLEALALELTQAGRLPLVGVPSSAGFDHSPISVYLYLPPFLLTADPIPATIYGGLVGVAAVALCAWLAKRWPGGGRKSAWVAALLFAASPWAVAFSRKIWQVVFVPLLALAFVGLAVSALVEDSGTGTSRARTWNLAWALVVYAVLVQVHPSAVSLAPALVLWLLLFRRRVNPGPLLVGGFLAVATGLPFLVHQIQNGWPALAALRAMPPATWDLSSIRLAWQAITGQGIESLAGQAYPLLRLVPQLGWLLNLAGGLVVASGLYLGWQMVARWKASDARQRQAAQVDFFLLSWLLVPVLFNLRHSLDLYLHFFALVTPAAYLLIGRALQEILDRPWGSRLRVVAGTGVWMLAAVQVVALVQMGRFVATNDTAGGFGTPLRHYLAVANRTVAQVAAQGAAEVLVVGQGDSVVVDEAPAIFDVLLRGRVAYRFVDGESTALFPAHPALVLLTPGAGASAAWYRSLPAPTLALGNGYSLAVMDGAWPQAQFEPVPGLRLFANGVEAQGYTWQADPAADSSLRFWLLWQVLWLNPDDTHFFVHVLDAAGSPWGQRDSAGYPTAYRQKGDRIASKFDITYVGAAPVRPDLARIGQYLFPQIENVPVIDEAGNPAADSIVIDARGRGQE